MKPKLQKKKVGDHDIAYREYGNGEPVFCIPPWPSSSLFYYSLAKLIPDVKFIAFDQPGWGGNTEPLKGNYKFEEYVTLTEEFVKSFGFAHNTLLGYSYGGMIAQSILQREKIPTKKLVLVSTMRRGRIALTPKPKELMIRFAYAFSAFPPLSNYFSKNITDVFKFIEKRSGKYYTEEFTETEDFQNLMKDLQKSSSRIALSAAVQLLELTFLTKEFKKVPALLIGGHDESELYKKEMNDLAKRTGGTLHFIKDATHNHLFFEPEKSATIISKFLKE